MDFSMLAIIVLAGLVGPLLAFPRGLHVPVVIGPLIMGIVLGTTGVGYLDASDPTFTFLAQIGFGLVMFVAGTHGCGTYNPPLASRICGALLLASFRGIGHDRESLAISATALTTFAAATEFTTSTLPIDFAKMK